MLKVGEGPCLPRDTVTAKNQFRDEICNATRLGQVANELARVPVMLKAGLSSRALEEN